MTRFSHDELISALRDRGWGLRTRYSVTSLIPGREQVSVVPAWRPHSWAGFLSNVLRLPWDGSGEFHGGLLWFFNYDLGLGPLDPTGQLAALRILGYREADAGLLGTSAWELDKTEFAVAHASLVIASTYGWDAVLVGNADFAIELSHDEIVTMKTNANACQKVRAEIGIFEERCGHK